MRWLLENIIESRVSVGLMEDQYTSVHDLDPFASLICWKIDVKSSCIEALWFLVMLADYDSDDQNIWEKDSKWNQCIWHRRLAWCYLLECVIAFKCVSQAICLVVFHIRRCLLPKNKLPMYGPCLELLFGHSRIGFGRLKSVGIHYQHEWYYKYIF